MARTRTTWKGDTSAAMAGAVGRGNVYHALPGDVDRALSIARGIRHPWYRCQSLAAVARHVDAKARPALLTEAFKAANEQDEPNRIVTVASWPLEVLAEFGPRDRLHRETATLVSTIAAEPHSLRRADAIHMVLHRVWRDQMAREMVLPPFREACAAGHGWRRDRLLRWTARRLAEIDQVAAREMVDMIEEDRIRRRAQREVDRTTEVGP